MIEFKIIVFILLIHFLADFALQTDEQAKKKSTSTKWLTYHIATYTMCWFFASWMLFERWDQVIAFTLFTYVSHFITDYITSRMGKPFWTANNHHDGFVVIGGDQLIHYVCLFGSYLIIV